MTDSYRPWYLHSESEEVQSARLPQVECFINHEFRKEQYAVINAVQRFFGIHDALDTPWDQRGLAAKSLLSKLAEHGVVLAGGAIVSIFTDSKISDLDFYCHDESQLQHVRILLNAYFPGSEFISANALTYHRKVGTRKYQVQLITRFTGSCQEIFDAFDFTVTQAGFDFPTGAFAFGDRFFADMAARKLVFLGSSHFPICAMYRTKKYMKKGFEVPGSTIMHISLSIVRLKIENYKQLKEQLMGIDTMILQNLLKHREFEDSLPVDYGVFLEHVFSYINHTLTESEEFPDGE
jgi:hypothetical protein